MKLSQEEKDARRWQKYANSVSAILGWKYCTGFVSDYLSGEYGGRAEIVHLYKDPHKIRECVAKVILARKK